MRCSLLSFDWAYSDKLVKKNNCVKCPFVAVGVLSPKLRAQPLRTKGVEETAKTFGRMITKTKALKVVW